MWLTFTGITFVSGQNEELKSRIFLKEAPAAHAGLKKSFELDPTVILTSSSDPAGDIREGRLDAMVEFVPPKAALPVENNFGTRITFDESRDQSNRAKIRIDQKVSRYRETYLEQQASKEGLTREQFQDFWVDDDNISTNPALMMVLPLFFIIMLAVGAMHPAIDSTAGERENSTWETVLASATSRTNILVSKYLYVATMSFTAAFLNLFAMMLSMGTVLSPFFKGKQGGFSIQIPPQSAPLILLSAALLALFVAAGMMILASFARNYKEGQSMVSPFYLALIIPVMFLQAPGVEFTPRLALIPMANVLMMFRESIQGVYHWRLIGMTLAVEALCVMAALRIAMLVIQHEDFVMGSYSGSFGKFAKERLMKK